jgi:ech hydrogenase subunit C
MFDVERLGVINTGNPKHADIFLVTGAVNPQSNSVIRNIYGQMPEPKVVVAVGTCACSGGIFRECYNISGGVDTTIPVDVYVAGCAARPEAIIDGVVRALAVLDRKYSDMKEFASGMDKTVFGKATKDDLPAILALEKIAYYTESELYDDAELPVQAETVKGLEVIFEKEAIVKATINGKLVGSARGFLNGETASVGYIAVHPYCQREGIGVRLLKELEAALIGAKRFELRIGSRSEQGRWLERQGFKCDRTQVVSPSLSWVYFQKESA